MDEVFHFDGVRLSEGLLCVFLNEDDVQHELVELLSKLGLHAFVRPHHLHEDFEFLSLRNLYCLHYLLARLFPFLQPQ